MKHDRTPNRTPERLSALALALLSVVGLAPTVRAQEDAIYERTAYMPWPYFGGRGAEISIWEFANPADDILEYGATEMWFYKTKTGIEDGYLQPGPLYRLSDVEAHPYSMIYISDAIRYAGMHYWLGPQRYVEVLLQGTSSNALVKLTIQITSPECSVVQRWSTTGLPIWAPGPDGTPCDDGFVCSTSSNVCVAGVCVAGPAPADTVCRPASCTATGAVPATTCGAYSIGWCPGDAPPEVPCGAYACESGACLTQCQAAADCAPGHYCDVTGACVAQRGLGEVCDASDACGTGHCVDGVCCDVGCAGQCQACDVTGSEGTCSPVTGAPHGARPACASDASDCGGACDGANVEACAYPSTSIACEAASCASGFGMLAGACDGAGACNTGATTTCAPYVCGASACLESCTSDLDCISGHLCSAGACTSASASDGGVPDAAIDGGVPDAAIDEGVHDAAIDEGGPDASIPDDGGAPSVRNRAGCAVQPGQGGLPSRALGLAWLVFAASIVRYRRRLVQK